MKVIAIQRGLESLKRDLETIGFKTVYHDEISEPIDALVYLEETNNRSLKSVSQWIDNGFQGLSPNYNQAGALLINAKNLTAEDIRRVVDQRLYSPLF
jgi:hypothetical protein